MKKFFTLEKLCLCVAVISGLASVVDFYYSETVNGLFKASNAIAWILLSHIYSKNN